MNSYKYSNRREEGNKIQVSAEYGFSWTLNSGGTEGQGKTENYCQSQGKTVQGIFPFVVSVEKSLMLIHLMQYSGLNTYTTVYFHKLLKLLITSPTRNKIGHQLRI